MSDTSKVAKNLRAFVIAINAHDRENPNHEPAWGIGLAYFDMERLDFDEGEEIIPGITIHGDDGVTGNFRVLCNGEHDENLVEEEVDITDAISDEQLVPVLLPRRGGDDEDERAF